MRRKFIIEYESDKPLLPNEHLFYTTHPDCHEQNIEVLKMALNSILEHLPCVPIEEYNRSISQYHTQIQNRTELNGFIRIWWKSLLLRAKRSNDFRSDYCYTNQKQTEPIKS